MTASWQNTKTKQNRQPYDYPKVVVVVLNLFDHKIPRLGNH